jgi:hypothetical protein
MLEFLHFWCLTVTLTNIYFCSGFNYRHLREERWSAGQPYGQIRKEEDESRLCQLAT